MHTHTHHIMFICTYNYVHTHVQCGVFYCCCLCLCVCLRVVYLHTFVGAWPPPHHHHYHRFVVTTFYSIALFDDSRRPARACTRVCAIKMASYCCVHRERSAAAGAVSVLSSDMCV